MYLDRMLDSLAILATLAGIAPDSSVCFSRPSAVIAVSYKAVPALGMGASASVTAFVNVNVVPMDSERVLLNHTVIVRGGRIATLGPASKVKVPEEAIRIEGRGKYLMPGLADMHTHGVVSSDGFGEGSPAQLFSYLASGVTAFRHLNNVSRTAAQTFKDSPEAKEGLIPYIYLATKMHAFMQPGISVDSAVAAYKAAGFDFVTPNDDSIMAAASRAGLPPGSHSHGESLEALERLGAYGGSIDHLYSFLTYKFLDSLYTGSADKSASDIQYLAAAARRTGIWVTPTLDCMESLSGRLTPRAVTIHRQLVKAMQDSGVGILLGAEGAYAYRELAALVRAGLTPYQALLTGTRNVAQYLGILDSTGTVAVGKRADLVMLYGNPLSDIRNASEPAGVMRAGHWFDRAELDQRLVASSESWFTREMMRSRISMSKELTREQRRNISEHVKRFSALNDSLTTASEKGAVEHLVRLQADELTSIRSNLIPEFQELFDPMARIWLREQARKGHQVTVAGVAGNSDHRLTGR